MHTQKRIRWPAWLALVLILTSSLNTASASSLYSGIEGRVISSGIRNLVDGIEATQPVPTKVSIYSVSTGRLVAAIRTDSNGRFRVPLHPGTYRVEVPPIVIQNVGISTSSASAPPVRVRVVPRSFAPVTVRYGYFQTVS